MEYQLFSVLYLYIKLIYEVSLVRGYRRRCYFDFKLIAIAYFAFKAGNCYEELDNVQEALRYYNLAKSSDTLMIDSTLSMEIERRIQELGGGSDIDSESVEAVSE